jgi:predicted TIM-barrel fold metal-dependent hydrolase
MAQSASKPGPIYTPGPGTGYFRPELRGIKIIGVEEHAAFPEFTARVPDEGAAQHARKMIGLMSRQESVAFAHGRLTNLGTQRTSDMDEGGIAMQVLSLAGAVNSTFLEPEAGLALSRDINNAFKKAVDANPKRFVALADLPVHAPQLAIQELRRCVKELGFVGAMFSGSVGGTGKFLDAPEFDELLSEFEQLDVPLYLHPGIAPKPVMETYYTFPGDPDLSATLGGMGWGWHNEVAIHTLRLCISGALDKHPRLKVVIGHQGEMMPMMMQRFDAMFDERTFGFKRSVGEMLRSQVWIAISGLFSIPPTLVAIQTWGVDKVLFANDYPFIDAQRVPEFIRALGDVIGPSDLKKICQTNAEELFKIEA